MTDRVHEALSLLQRRAILQRSLRACSNPGRRALTDRELLRIREQLARCPDAVQAITQAAAELQRSVEDLTVRDVLKRYRATVAVIRPLSTAPSAAA